MNINKFLNINNFRTIVWPRALVCLTFVGMTIVGMSGCTQQDASDSIEKTEESIKKAADAVSDEAGKMVDQGKEMAGDMAKKGNEIAAQLSEKAQSYLNPLKAKFGELDGLKESPEKLKTAVSELIKSIEDKTSDIALPESISDSLTAVKEKLVALAEYLEGEYEQSQINEKLSEIRESIKSGLGLSSK
jgi:uncharacterized coiled-coil DUF342 family protein